jgi:hypothetical protein
MHGIKYFFLNKNNQTIQGGKLPKTLPKITIFQNPGGARTPLITLGPPLGLHLFIAAGCWLLAAGYWSNSGTIHAHGTIKFKCSELPKISHEKKTAALM